MNNKLSVALALVAGLLGGLLTRYIAPPVAFAQAQPPTPKEIRAQSFTLVDSSDRTAGTFTAEPVLGARSFVVTPGPGLPNNQSPIERVGPMRIVLRDPNGREIWSAGGGARMLPAVTETSR